MTPTALARHLTLPAAVNRSSGEVVPLSYTLDHPADVVSTDSLTQAQKIALIRARWLAGEWSDIVYDHMGLIDRDRAVRPTTTIALHKTVEVIRSTPGPGLRSPGDLGGGKSRLGREVCFG